jgi:hypothetical protein
MYKKIIFILLMSFVTAEFSLQAMQNESNHTTSILKYSAGGLLGFFGIKSTLSGAHDLWFVLKRGITGIHFYGAKYTEANQTSGLGGGIFSSGFRKIAKEKLFGTMLSL